MGLLDEQHVGYDDERGMERRGGWGTVRRGEREGGEEKRDRRGRVERALKKK